MFKGRVTSATNVDFLMEMLAMVTVKWRVQCELKKIVVYLSNGIVNNTGVPVEFS